MAYVAYSTLYVSIVKYEYVGRHDMKVRERTQYTDQALRDS